jgi:hypothetical protein
MTFDLSQLTVDDFETMIGHEFRVCWEGLDEKVTLVTVKQLRPGLAGNRNAFSLIFQGHSKETLLNQHIHPLEAKDGRLLEIFLVPIGQNDDGTYLYEAVFS